MPFSIIHVLSWTEDRGGEKEISAQALLQFQSRTEHPQRESCCCVTMAWSWMTSRGACWGHTSNCCELPWPLQIMEHSSTSAHFNRARQLAAGISWRHSSSSLIYFRSWLGMQEANEHRNGSKLPRFTSSPTPPTHLHSTAPIAIHLSSTAPTHTNEPRAGAPFLLSCLYEAKYLISHFLQVTKGLFSISCKLSHHNGQEHHLKFASQCKEIKICSLALNRIQNKEKPCLSCL